MSHLLAGMDLRVGTPGANQLHRVVSDKTQGLLEMLLNRRTMRLALPAAVVATIVFDA